MRLFKHILRKLYHLIAFLSLFFIVSLSVNAESVTVSYNRLVTTSSNLTDGIQCNNSYCVNYNVPVRFDTDFTTLWTASSSKTCNSQATVSGHLAIEGSGELTINPDWIRTNLLSVYLTTNDNNVSYSCNYSNPNNGHLYYTCFVGSMSSSFNIGYTFRQRTTSTSYTNTTSIAYRSVDINCSSSGAGNTQEVIDNNNFNTDRIINSDNSNTDRIINDNRRENDEIKNKLDENNQKQIESQKVCKNIDKSNIKTDNKYLNNSGDLVNLNQTGVTNYIKINTNSELKVLNNFNGTSSLSYCFYDTNKEIISCDLEQNLTIGSIVSIPSNSSYVRFSIIKSTNRPSFELCNNGNQALNDSVNDLNDTLNNDSPPDIDFSDLEVSSDTPISDLITMPLTILNSLIQTLDGTCSNYTIPFFYNNTITFPCFTISDYLGNTVTNYIDLFICFYMCYNIAMLVISVFEDITSLRDIYDNMYVPKHADTGYQPKHAKGGAN